MKQASAGHPAGQPETESTEESKRSRLRMLISPVLIVVLGYLAWCALLYAKQDSIMFPRSMTGEFPRSAPQQPGLVQVWIEGEDGSRTEGWFLAAPGASAEAPAPAVLFAHGNAELIDHCLAVAGMYHRTGVSVLLAEYRGYGRSTGRPSQRAIREDMRGFHAWLAARPDVDGAKLIYHGRSLGGAAVIQLAEEHEPAALIAETTFTSAAAIAARFLVPTVLLRHPFRSDRIVPKLECPMLIMHGTRDTIVPASHGRKLSTLAKRAEYVEFDSGHNDFPPDFHAYARVVEEFLRTNGIIPAHASAVR